MRAFLPSLAPTLALILALPLAATAGEDDHSDHLSELDGLRILHAWTNASEEDHAMVYLEIENTTETELTLLGGEADIAKEVHLMAVDISDPSKVLEVEDMPIPAKSAFNLEPGGVFLELHEVSQPRVKGEDFEMHLLIEPLGEVEIHVEIEAADATTHSHAGHNH
jgi:copper(I)-binding protein